MEEMEPMFVMHNIFIATTDYIIHIGEDVIIYHVCTFICILCDYRLGNLSYNWSEKTIGLFS